MAVFLDFWPYFGYKEVSKEGIFMKRSLIKLEVLRILRSQDNSLSLNEILREIGDKCSERSLRRWIAELVTEGFVQKVGQKRSTKYNSVKALTEKSSLPFSSRSLDLLEMIRRPIGSRNPASYNLSFLKEYEPNKTQYIPNRIKEELHQLGKRTKKQEPAGTYAKQIYNRILIELSYNSSRLEGNTYSLIDTQRLLLEGKGAEGKMDQETVMILNHKETIRYIVEQIETITIEQKTICNIHYLLSDGLVSNESAGKVRDQGVFITGTSYVPSENPGFLQEALGSICHKATLIKDPFEQCFFLLIHISYLQAFIDVNKRTARLASNIPLLKNNFVPLSFNDIEKEDYISALIAVYEFNKYSPMLDLFVFSYRRSCQLYTVTLEALDFDPLRVYYRKERRNIIREIVVNLIHEDSMDEFINDQLLKLVDAEDRDNVRQDIYEDLKLLDPVRITGMGITLDQLESWKKHQ